MRFDSVFCAVYSKWNCSLCCRFSDCHSNRFRYQSRIVLNHAFSFQMNPSDAIAEFVFYVGFVMTMLTQIFLPCYYGNDIVLKSGQLTKAVYMSNWTDCSMRYRRLVIVYMELMKRPRKLVVGQLFTLTLDSFLLVRCFV